MANQPASSPSTPRVPEGAFPNTLARGQTLLVACPGDPTPYAVGLQALCRFGTERDTGIVVTTTESATATIDRYTTLCPAPDSPQIRVVDTTSRDQSLDATYDETPVVYTPSPDDLERLAIGISELAATTPTTNANRHLVVRSLTPILDAAPTARVCTVLERTIGLRTPTGFCLVGIDYTAHDEATMQAVAAETDGVLWVTHSDEDNVDLAYEPSLDRHRHRPSEH